MKKYTAIIVMLLIFLSPISTGSEQSENYYEVQVSRGRWQFYKGVRYCYFIKNDDLTEMEFGGVGRYDYKVKIKKIERAR